ncbi:hypothetical protein [uncultured Muribaculum sp.]|nr:hypothetical protein [uncultured Muribaculum sp.]
MTLEKLKGCDSVEFKELKQNYGENWAAIFDDLRSHQVASSPFNGKVQINHNYLPPAIEYYKEQLHEAKRIKWSYRQSWAAILISVISILVSVLLSTIWR